MLKWNLERCSYHGCGRRINLMWRVSDETWNRVTNSYGHVLCLACFDERAQQRKIAYRAELVIEGVMTWEQSKERKR